MNEHDMVEDTEQEEVSELDYPPEGELSSLMLMGFPSDRFIWYMTAVRCITSAISATRHSALIQNCFSRRRRMLTT